MNSVIFVCPGVNILLRTLMSLCLSPESHDGAGNNTYLTKATNLGLLGAYLGLTYMPATVLQYIYHICIPRTPKEYLIKLLLGGGGWWSLVTGHCPLVKMATRPDRPRDWLPSRDWFTYGVPRQRKNDGVHMYIPTYVGTYICISPPVSPRYEMSSSSGFFFLS